MNRSLSFARVFGLFLALLFLPMAPPAFAADYYVLGGGGGGGGGGRGSAVGGGGGGAGATSYIGNGTDPLYTPGAGRGGSGGTATTGSGGGGGGGAGGAGGWAVSGPGGNGVSPGGTAGTGGYRNGETYVDGIISGNFGNAAEGAAGSPSSNGAGGRGSDATATRSITSYDNLTVQGGGGGGSGGSGWTGSAAGLGGQGGLGGNASLTVDVDATYANITVQGGAGGRGGNVGTSMTAGVAGGAGGSAALNAAGQAVTVAGTLTVASGANGETGNNSGTTQGGAGGAGGAASFTADTLIAPTINLTKNGGAVNFNVTNLEIGSGFNTTLNATGLGAGDTANIAVLLLTGDKNFTVNGTGVTVGQLNINNGTLNDANWSNLVGGGITYSAQNIALTGTVTVDISDNQSTDRNLTGAGAALTKSGSGTLTLSGANTYTGDTTVAGGTLAVTGTLGGGAYAGDISNAGALVFDQTASQLLSGIISGTGGITKDGSGTLDLIGDNTYTGTTRVSGGALTIGTAGGDWNISDHLILENGTTLNAGGLIGMTSGNLAMLDVYGSANWSGGDLNMGAGNAMNFYVPTDMAAGGTMLTVDGAADITNSAVAVGINGGSSDLKAGDTITLIDATGGLTANQGGSRAQGLQGIAKIFEFDLTTDADKLFATVASAQNNEQLKALSEGRAAGLAFVSQGADMIMGQGMGSLLSATRTDSIASFGAAIGGGSSRYKTGSHIDVDGVSMLVGLGLRTPRESGSIVAGAFFEAGWGNYSSRNSFNNAPSVKGKGDTSYYGGGVLGRYEAPTGMYAEASLRAGRVKNDFRSSDILNSDSDTTKYDSGSAYYGAHAGLGYVWNMNEKASLDMSTRYIWTHQASDSVTISGDRIKFKDADSQRWRTGARLSYAASDYVSPYVGAYYDYEFGGKVKATANGESIAAPSLKGGTGVGELGLSFAPSRSTPLSIDLGVQGYTGRRQGVTGSLQLKFEF